MLLAHFIKSLTHDAKVLLGGESAAETFGGSAVRNIVEQALTRGTDHSNDIGTLACACLSLDNIFVDVTRSNDNIKVRLRAFAYGI